MSDTIYAAYIKHTQQKENSEEEGVLPQQDPSLLEELLEDFAEEQVKEALKNEPRDPVDIPMSWGERLRYLWKGFWKG